MNIDNGTILVLIIILGIVSYLVIFVLGLIIGLFYANRGVSTSIGVLSKSGRISTNSTNNAITIDTSKVVTEIKTEGMEKKYTSLGDTKNTKDNISDSISKLKKLKE